MLFAVDDRPHVGGLVERIADLQRAEPTDQAVEYLVVDVLMQEETRSGRAALALASEARSEKQSVDEVVVDGIRKDDRGVLAAEFERDVGQTFSRLAADAAAHLGGAGEGDLVDSRMRRERGSDEASATGQRVDYASGEVPVAHLREQQDGQRGVIRGLEDHGVSRGERGRHFEAGDHERRVPRQDAGDHAKRLKSGVLQLVVAGRQGRPFDFSGDAREISEQCDEGRHLRASLGTQRVTGVKGRQASEVFRPCLDLVGDAGESSRPFGEVSCPPVGERCPGRSHRPVDILHPRRRNPADHAAAMGRVGDLAPLPRGRMHLLPANPHRLIGSGSGRIGVDGAIEECGVGHAAVPNGLGGLADREIWLIARL